MDTIVVQMDTAQTINGIKYTFQVKPWKLITAVEWLVGVVTGGAVPEVVKK
jgi:hypothetical protein